MLKRNSKYLSDVLYKIFLILRCKCLQLWQSLATLLDKLHLYVWKNIKNLWLWIFFFHLCWNATQKISLIVVQKLPDIKMEMLVSLGKVLLCWNFILFFWQTALACLRSDWFSCGIFNRGLVPCTHIDLGTEVKICLTSERSLLFSLSCGQTRKCLSLFFFVVVYFLLFY